MKLGHGIKWKERVVNIGYLIKILYHRKLGNKTNGMKRVSNCSVEIGLMCQTERKGISIMVSIGYLKKIVYWWIFGN